MERPVGSENVKGMDSGTGHRLCWLSVLVFFNVAKKLTWTFSLCFTGHFKTAFLFILPQYNVNAYYSR